VHDWQLGAMRGWVTIEEEARGSRIAKFIRVAGVIQVSVTAKASMLRVSISEIIDSSLRGFIEEMSECSTVYKA